MINIEGLEKAEVLAVLYNAAKAQQGPYNGIDAATAQKWLDYGMYVDEMNGRILQVDLTQDSFDETFYDAANGSGMAQRALNTLRISSVTYMDSWRDARAQRRVVEEREERKEREGSTIISAPDEDDIETPSSGTPIPPSFNAFGGGQSGGAGGGGDYNQEPRPEALEAALTPERRADIEEVVEQFQSNLPVEAKDLPAEAPDTSSTWTDDSPVEQDSPTETVDSSSDTSTDSSTES